MNAFYIPDHLLQSSIKAFEAGDAERVQQILQELKTDYPLDERVYYFEYTLFESLGDHPRAMNALWRCLSIRPKDPVFLNAMADLVIQDRQKKEVQSHDFRLKSGERQTASSIEKIRPDHTARYHLASKILRQKYGTCSQLTGLDLFCGNGYGSKIVNSTTGARMVGIDGSEEAVALANADYGNHRTVFFNQYFPFSFRHAPFDFVICYESIEHIQAHESLITQIFKCTQGPVFISVPAEETLPFAVNEKFFKFHYRHFTIGEIQEICNRLGTHKLEGIYGQETYVLNNQKVSGTIAPEQMYITPNNRKSQFHLLHFDSAKPE